MDQGTKRRHGPSARDANGYEGGDEDSSNDEAQKNIRQDSTVPRSPQDSSAPPLPGVENVVPSSSSQANLVSSVERRPSSILLGVHKGYLRDSLPFPKATKELRFNDDELEEHVTMSPPPTSSGSISPTASSPLLYTYANINDGRHRQSLDDLPIRWNTPARDTLGNNDYFTIAWLIALPFQIAAMLAPLLLFALVPLVPFIIGASMIFTMIFVPTALVLVFVWLLILSPCLNVVRAIATITMYPAKSVMTPLVPVTRWILAKVFWFLPERSGQSGNPNMLASDPVYNIRWVLNGLFWVLTAASHQSADHNMRSRESYPNNSGRLYPNTNPGAQRLQAGHSISSHSPLMQLTDSDSNEDTSSGSSDPDQVSHADVDAGEDSPLPRVRPYQNSPPRPPPSALRGTSYSLDFGTFSLNTIAAVSPRSPPVPTESTAPGGGSYPQVRDREQSTPTRLSCSPDPSALRDHLGSPLRTENMTPKHHGISSNMASALSGTPVKSSLGEFPSPPSESPTRDGSPCARKRSDASDLQCCCLPLSQTASPNGAQTNRAARDARCGDAENTTTWKLGTWSSGRRLLSAAKASLDLIAGEISQAPSPVFGSQAAQSSDLAVLARNASQIGVLPEVVRAEGTEEAFPSIQSGHEFNDQPVSIDRIPSLSLSEEEPQPPPSIRSSKRRRRKTVTPSPKKDSKPRNSFGIDHSYSPPEEVPKQGVQQKDEHGKSPTLTSCSLSEKDAEDLDRSALHYCTVMAARIPDEPDPGLLLGSPFNLLPQLTRAALPICTNRPKPSTHNTDPPPDVLDSISSLAHSEPSRNDSITDLTAEAYMSMFRFQAICPPGPTQYISRRLTNAVLLERCQHRQEAAHHSIITMSRAWGLHYLVEKFTQRLNRRRERGLGVVRGDDDYDSDDDTPRPSISSASGLPAGCSGVNDGDRETDEVEAQAPAEGAADVHILIGQTRPASHPLQTRATRKDRSSGPALESSAKDYRQDFVADQPARKISFTEPTKPAHEPDDILPSRGRKRSPPPAPPSYEHATLGQFDATAEDIAIPVPVRRDEEDRASTSTSISERQRKSLVLARKVSPLGWSPMQSKSTASLGLSAGQSVVRNVELRDVVSRRGQSSAARRSVEGVLFERPEEHEEESKIVGSVLEKQNSALRVGTGKGKGKESSAPSVLGKSPLRVKTSGHGRDDEDAGGSSEQRRANLNKGLNLKSLTSRGEVDTSASPNSENVSPKTLVTQSSSDKLAAPPSRLPISPAEQKCQQRRKHKRSVAVKLSEGQRQAGEMHHSSRNLENLHVRLHKHKHKHVAYLV